MTVVSLSRIPELKESISDQTKYDHCDFHHKIIISIKNPNDSDTLRI